MLKVNHIIHDSIDGVERVPRFSHFYWKYVSPKIELAGKPFNPPGGGGTLPMFGYMGAAEGLKS